MYQRKEMDGYQREIYELKVEIQRLRLIITEGGLSYEVQTKPETEQAAEGAGEADETRTAEGAQEADKGRNPQAGRKKGTRQIAIPPRAELYQLYCCEKLSIKGCADFYGVSLGTMNRWLDEYEIERRGLSEAAQGRTQSPSIRRADRFILTEK